MTGVTQVGNDDKQLSLLARTRSLIKQASNTPLSGALVSRSCKRLAARTGTAALASWLSYRGCRRRCESPRRCDRGREEGGEGVCFCPLFSNHSRMDPATNGPTPCSAMQTLLVGGPKELDALANPLGEMPMARLEFFQVIA